MRPRVVVTGIGVVTSLGTETAVFWDNLLRGRSGITPVTAFDVSGHAARVGGEVRAALPSSAAFPGIKIGRASLMGLAAARSAMADARLGKAGPAGRPAGVFMGTTMGEVPVFEAIDHAWIKDGDGAIDSASVFGAQAHNISGAIALEWDLRGRNLMFTTACAAGNYAISRGYEELTSGGAEIALAGGADAMSWISFTGFNKVGAVSPDKCRPFDRDRRGMIPGEGAGVLVLETLESALKRGAPVHAEILGCGFSCDARHMTQPDAAGIARCLADALARAGLEALDVDYICAHGTGTPQNDKAESAAIKSVFGGRTPPVSSIKSMLGHAMGAASAIEAAACCLSVKHDLIAPTINFETPDPECDIDCVPNIARGKEVNIALNNGFAFGGCNSCLVIKKYRK